MMLGAWTCGICMGMIAATGAVSKHYPSRAFAAGWAGAAFVLAFQFSFGIGYVRSDFEQNPRVRR